MEPVNASEIETFNVVRVLDEDEVDEALKRFKPLAKSPLDHRSCSPASGRVYTPS